ncbi:hypothetical protein ABZ864_05975 [Streptomyces sp. NPDC047082]|uniref:hypothetical protein n=1 Tax=Streptomyces sp. NPDC047082 TaxID=3155259 RepID=UPI0033C7196A
MGSDVLLGYARQDPVRLLDAHRTAHVAILGKSRFGKTTLLEHLVLNDMRDGTAAIVIDAHGDLTKRLISLAPPAAQDKIVLVEPNDERPFGLNLYECPEPVTTETVSRTVGDVQGIFLKLMGAEGRGLLPVIDQGLRSAARVLIANQLTMAELPLLYLNPVFRSRALAKVSNPAVLQYWRDYEAITSRGQQEMRNPVLNKASRFLEDDLIRLMVSQGQTTIPFKQVMEDGGTLLFSLAHLDREFISFLGMVLLSVLNNLLHQRERVPEKDRKRVHLYLDEYGRFATSTTRHMLEECAKYGLGLTLAHQSLSQTPEGEALKVETLISFRLSAEDAYRVAGNFDLAPTRTKQEVRQRTEPEYREVSEIVWNSEDARQRYEDARAELSQISTELADLKRRKDSTVDALKVLLDSESHEEDWAEHIFDSFDGSVEAVYMLYHLVSKGFSSTFIDQLREILNRLHKKHGRVPRGLDQLDEAYRWFHYAVEGHKELERQLEQRIELQQGRQEWFEAFTDALYREHASKQTRREIIGHKVVKDLEGDVIYDSAEKIDQSHADRQAEIANMLTQLPRYEAYCHLFGADGASHEYQIRTLPPAPSQARIKEQELLERAERLRKKLRGADEIRVADFGGWAPEIGSYFKQQEFQDALHSFMKDMRREISKSDDEIFEEAALERARKRSRQRYGTPREEVEQEIRRRQGRPDAEGGASHPAKKPDDGQPPSSRVDLVQAKAREENQCQEAAQAKPTQQQSMRRPTIGRRTPKKEQ